MLDPGAIVVEDDAQLAARCGAVLVWATTQRLDQAPLDRLRQVLEDMAAEQQHGVALLLIAIGESELPKLDDRRRIVKALTSLGDRLQAVAAALEGDKPWASLARMTVESVVRQVETKITGTRLPLRVFGNREDAIIWLGEVVLGADHRPISTDALAAAVEDVCARLLG
jgi:hypothetical protein